MSTHFPITLGQLHSGEKRRSRSELSAALSWPLSYTRGPTLEFNNQKDNNNLDPNACSSANFPMH